MISIALAGHMRERTWRQMCHEATSSGGATVARVHLPAAHSGNKQRANWTNFLINALHTLVGLFNTKNECKQRRVLVGFIDGIQLAAIHIYADTSFFSTGRVPPIIAARVSIILTERQHKYTDGKTKETKHGRYY